MPVYYRPARVTIDEGASPLTAIAGIIVLAVIVGAAAAIIADLITALLILAAVAVAGSLTVLAVILRRTGMSVAIDHRPPPVTAIPETTERRAITPTRIWLRGQVVQPSPAEEDTLAPGS